METIIAAIIAGIATIISAFIKRNKSIKSEYPEAVRFDSTIFGLIIGVFCALTLLLFHGGSKSNIDLVRLSASFGAFISIGCGLIFGLISKVHPNVRGGILLGALASGLGWMTRRVMLEKGILSNDYEWAIYEAVIGAIIGVITGGIIGWVSQKIYKFSERENS